ncbi:acyl-CoA reductase [Bergeyella sp. RCAD1439]|uniref:acyl-CoA reductase n=1 Tax=Bergeyella anatis TaxID=3113737 RepID=UPI002E1897E2|nr:acyl-CoA reductase [Bergeyella sp. RCAD1439]
MNTEKKIGGLVALGEFIQCFFETNPPYDREDFRLLAEAIHQSEIENSWFTYDNQKFALLQWARQLTLSNITRWLEAYTPAKTPKKVGLILAGNIPLVGFHDVVCVLLSGHIPLIKLSSKDKRMIPLLLALWQRFSESNFHYEIVEKLEGQQAVIATGSNNTAKYLDYYFKKYKNIIRKNRTSVGILSGKETSEDLQRLGEDVFRYFGLGCRNVSRLWIPQDYPLDPIFENFIGYGEVINHHSYANNYDYNKAVYLLNQEKFWDNNFVMLKEDPALFSPLSVLHFTRYSDLSQVHDFLDNHQEEIQCVVAHPSLELKALKFGEAQSPSLDTYADNIDTMAFLQAL